MTRLLLSQIPALRPLEVEALLIPAQQLGLDDLLHGQVMVGYSMRRVEDKVYADFKVQEVLRLKCSRCLEPFEEPMTSEFCVQFERNEEEERLPLDSDEPRVGVTFFRGDELDFGDDLRQELELLVPFVSLCKKDCRGLCPHCGENLNIRKCSCPAPMRKPGPFDKLQHLFLKDKEN